MKKIIMLSAAAAALAMAGQANAAKVGNDGAAWYNITGTAGSYCVLGQSSATAGGNKNVTINVAPGGFSRGSTADDGATGSDGLVTITALQDPHAGSANNKADTAAAWRAVFNLRHSICNSPFTVNAQSTNGGLKFGGSFTGTGFATSLPYTLEATFGAGDSGQWQASNLTGNPALITSTMAAMGDFKLTFDGKADHSAFLLEGDYTDQVTVTIQPSI